MICYGRTPIKLSSRIKVNTDIFLLIGNIQLVEREKKGQNGARGGCEVPEETNEGGRKEIISFFNVAICLEKNIDHRLDSVFMKRLESLTQHATFPTVVISQ